MGNAVGGAAAGDARAVLDAWRESGADRLDAVRFRFIEALARRSAGHDGAARRVLDDKLCQLVEAYGEALERAAGEARIEAPPRKPAAGPLARLADDLASRAKAGNALPEPALAAYFRDTWARVSTDRQLRQSLERVPGNAGPLNSSHLTHRSLSLMRDMSPGYLRQFLSYVEALSWLEQMQGGGAVSSKEVPGAATSPKKKPRAKPRQP